MNNKGSLIIVLFIGLIFVSLFFVSEGDKDSRKNEIQTEDFTIYYELGDFKYIENFFKKEIVSIFNSSKLNPHDKNVVFELLAQIPIEVVGHGEYTPFKLFIPFNCDKQDAEYITNKIASLFGLRKEMVYAEMANSNSNSVNKYYYNGVQVFSSDINEGIARLLVMTIKRDYFIDGGIIQVEKVENADKITFDVHIPYEYYVVTDMLNHRYNAINIANVLRSRVNVIDSNNKVISTSYNDELQTSSNTATDNN